MVSDIRDLSCFNIQSRLAEEVAVLASITAGLGHYSRGRHSDASRYFRSALSHSQAYPALLSRRARARLSHLAAFSSWMVRDLNNAESLFDSAIALNPGYWRSHAGRGFSWADRGEYLRALEFVVTAVRMSANDPDAIGMRGEIYRRAGEYELAQKDLDHAIASKPTEWWLYRERALLRAARGDPGGANADYSKALAFGEIASTCRSELYNNRGQVRFSLYKRDPTRNRDWLEAARADFSAALEIRPTYEMARRNRAVTYTELGLVRRSYSDYSQVLATNPNDYQARLARGRLLAENLSRPAEAMGDFEVAVQVRPQLPDAYFYRGLTHLRLGVPAAAVRDLEQVLRRTTDEDWTRLAKYWAAQAEARASS